MLQSTTELSDLLVEYGHTGKFTFEFENGTSLIFSLITSLLQCVVKSIDFGLQHLHSVGLIAK